MIGYLIIGSIITLISCVGQAIMESEKFNSDVRNWLWWIVTVGCIILWPVIVLSCIIRIVKTGEEL
jgi:hypothetical protein